MSTSLQTLLEHAENQRNEALAALMQAEEGLRRLQQQALQLSTYRDEYRTRQPGLGGHSVSIELLRSHHEFMQRLEQALEQQQGQLTGAEQRLMARRAALLALETKVASVRKLMERRGAEESRRSARIEQRLTDDAAHLRGREAKTRGLAWVAEADASSVTH